MPVIYTKTALKKIKKDDLIEMYLSQQQKMSQLWVNTEKLQEGLDKWVESHGKWMRESSRLKEENNRMFRFLESREIKYCEKCREYNEETEGFGFNGVFQDSEGEWVCDDCHDEPPERCEICDKRFDLHYTMNQCDGNLRDKYDDYFGSEKDQWDVCPDCIHTIC